MKRLPLLCLFLVSAAATLQLASCGGGSGSNQLPPPGGCTNSTYTPNYTANVTLRHWAHFPITVFFTQDAHYNAHRHDLIVTGFNQWVAATSSVSGGGVAWTETNNSAGADVVIHFFENTTPDGGLGLTTSFFSGSVMQSADMQIAFIGDDAEDQNTGAHEFGHALGIGGHSANQADMMYPSGNTHRCNCITTSDLNTLLTAYCATFSRAARLPVDRAALQHETTPPKTLAR